MACGSICGLCSRMRGAADVALRRQSCIGDEGKPFALSERHDSVPGDPVIQAGNPSYPDTKVKSLAVENQ